MSPSRPFGTWDSPLEVAQVAAQRLSRSSLASDGEALWWLEGRPSEGGRVVLVRAQPGSAPEVVSPPETSIRSRVHEYGGGAWCLLSGGSFAYVDHPSQRVFVATPGGEPIALSPAAPAGEPWHHGGLVAGPAGSVLAIRERHRDGAVTRSVVRLDPSVPGAETTLTGGRDFFGALAPSPGGDRLAWVAWDHPDMPWDATELWVGEFDPADGALREAVRVGADRLDGCSVDQPVWLGESTLALVADAEGWWQPWSWSGGELSRLSELDAEFQGPAWVLGQHTLVATAAGALACVWRQAGRDHVGVFDAASALREIPQPCVSVSSLCAHGDGLAWLGATPSLPTAPWVSTEEWGSGEPAVIAAAPPPLATNDVSVAEPLSIPLGERDVHANFYPPRLSGWEGLAGEAPPLVVFAHGGPTTNTETGFDVAVQTFTTRGYAVVAVDYAGSTGYGRDYRRLLEGRWGEADVDDCVEVARWLAKRGRVDGRRMAIRGSSAGGLTALGALVRSDLFAAATSSFGVSDLEGLVRTTHDFESRYADRLVGPLPEAADLYELRSPVNRVDDITGAVLLLQGEDDPVVPAEQTRSMAAALERRGLRCRALYFDGESHGFRRAETLVACWRAELSFYQEILLGAAPSVE
jgi:dipeptidyl aminopeptidase/acylaminoacyl peptidase